MAADGLRADVFPEFGAAFGDPTTDLFLGVLGAIIAGLIYEIVDHIRGPM